MSPRSPSLDSVAAAEPPRDDIPRDYNAAVRRKGGDAFGREHLPKAPSVILAKHQSAWDTMIFHTLSPDPAYVMKKELLFVPFYGWLAYKQGNIPVDRKGGASSGVPAQVQQTRARHILIKTSEVVSDADARRRLVDLRERVVQGGASFADLARIHSADLSAAKGGDLGWIYPGDTVPEFEQTMDALKPGELSQPVQSPFGWHLILVEDRRVQDVSDERKRGAARNALRERKSDEAYQDWLRQLRDRAYVEYRSEDR